MSKKYSLSRIRVTEKERTEEGIAIREERGIRTNTGRERCQHRFISRASLSSWAGTRLMHGKRFI